MDSTSHEKLTDDKTVTASVSQFLLQCRKALGSTHSLTDAQIETLANHMEVLADIFLEEFRTELAVRAPKKNTGKFENEGWTS